jgi:hypothetical protein
MAKKTYLCGYDIGKQGSDMSVIVLCERDENDLIKVLATEHIKRETSVEIIFIPDSRFPAHYFEIPIRTNPIVSPDEVWFVDLSNGSINKIINLKEDKSDAASTNNTS